MGNVKNLKDALNQLKRNEKGKYFFSIGTGHTYGLLVIQHSDDPDTLVFFDVAQQTPLGQAQEQNILNSSDYKI